MSDLIAQARKRYLAEHPVKTLELAAVNADTGQSDPFVFPNVGDMQIIGCKLGMEFLAICHDDDAVEDWIQTVMSIAKDPQWVGLLFANVFRGMNTVVGSMTDRAGLREHLARQAVDAWTRDFSGGDAS